MPDTTWLRTRVAGIGARILRTRPLMRAPIWLYQAGAGAMLGSRLLMLEHVGRKSGARRYVVLEVLGHPTPDRYLVASGFGEKAQWYRNIKANPRVRVYAGSRSPAPATARILTQQEADRCLGDYVRRHPRAWNRFRPVLERTLGSPIAETDTSLPIVELRLG
ncbi:MAG TPA: nitroreductase family deazaflavin-dependent oxidoreductase [Mycobacterium sp.]|jgi:deazaflavin-dependent oxidoreductase (nitroreductase family)|uniref:nitroreductase family deazaflavin-dependent oxidoreductase n=1 Tax=Mycobacterium sp. TaxID=1785 RepID=UPI002F3F3A59